MGGVWGVARAVGLSAVVLAGLLASGSAGAATLQITSSYRFTGDVTCDSDPCIEITGAGARVSGRGYTVTCAPNARGVVISAANVTLSNLNIVGCTTGVTTLSSANRAALKGIAATEFIDGGFLLEAPNETVTGCSATSTANPYGSFGFTVVSSASGSTLRGNSASAIWSGIYVVTNTTGLTVTSNNTSNNLYSGIEVESGAYPNTFSRNTALGNGTYDLADWGNCGDNLWRNNTFESDTETGADYGPGAGCIQ